MVVTCQLETLKKNFFKTNVHGTDYQSGIHIPKIRDIAKFFDIKYYKCITKYFRQFLKKLALRDLQFLIVIQ